MGATGSILEGARDDIGESGNGFLIKFETFIQSDARIIQSRQMQFCIADVEFISIAERLFMRMSSQGSPGNEEVRIMNKNIFMAFFDILLIFLRIDGKHLHHNNLPLARNMMGNVLRSSDILVFDWHMTEVLLRSFFQRMTTIGLYLLAP
jgi:hypothetical protein